MWCPAPHPGAPRPLPSPSPSLSYWHPLPWCSHSSPWTGAPVGRGSTPFPPWRWLPITFLPSFPPQLSPWMLLCRRGGASLAHTARALAHTEHSSSHTWAVTVYPHFPWLKIRTTLWCVPSQLKKLEEKHEVVKGRSQRPRRHFSGAFHSTFPPSLTHSLHFLGRDLGSWEYFWPVSTWPKWRAPVQEWSVLLPFPVSIRTSLRKKSLREEREVKGGKKGRELPGKGSAMTFGPEKKRSLRSQWWKFRS